MQKNSKIYIYPTDTLWGIGSSVFDEAAHRSVVNIKEADLNKPLSVMFSSIEELRKFVNFEKYMPIKKMEELLDNEITFGFRKVDFLEKMPAYIAPESDLIGVRVASHRTVSEMIETAGGAVTSTSLNKTGLPPIVDQKTAYEFYDLLRGSYSDILFLDTAKDIILSGQGSTFVSIKSSDQIEILREGSRVEQIRNILGI